VWWTSFIVLESADVVYNKMSESSMQLSKLSLLPKLTPRNKLPQPIDVTIASDVMDHTEFRTAVRFGNLGSWHRVDKGNGTDLYYKDAPKQVRAVVHARMERAIGALLHPIVQFYRLNSSVHDTDFRVHCDNVINGKKPHVASVFYLDDITDSGTAFFEHPVYGMSDPDQLIIFDKDDGAWREIARVQSRANSMVIYPATVFHGRYPWQQKQERIVLVSFMRYR
jgi:hypothetical protein